MRCCIPNGDDDEKENDIDCKQHTPEACAKKGGVNVGPGSCKPNPCAAGPASPS